MMIRIQVLLACITLTTNAFVPTTFLGSSRTTTTPLFVSIGLGPEQTQDDQESTKQAAVDYEIPNHEEYRTSRRSKLDEQCDAWFGKLMNSGSDGVLGPLAEQARAILTTPVPLVNNVELPKDNPEWTPYVSTRLPWTPLVPSFGLEEFGLPMPRRNAETWRHFDVPGLIRQDYSGAVQGRGQEKSLTNQQVEEWTQKLEQTGGWLDDDQCHARLVYINDCFVPELSKTTEHVYNLDSVEGANPQVVQYLARLTDGFTDELVVPVRNGDSMQTSYQKLSVPDHNLGPPTSQFAINTQQGTACFAALNTLKTGAVAVVHCPAGFDQKVERPQPVLIVQAQTARGGALITERDDDDDDSEVDVGVTLHPRTVVIAEEESRLSLVQSSVDLNEDDVMESHYKPKLYNGYTQMFVHKSANVTHSYLDETGGMVTGGVEKNDDEFLAGEPTARDIESQRPQLLDSHLEVIDVHVMGEDAAYEGTIMSMGGSGRVRIAHSVSLLASGAHAQVNGFSLSGGTQRTDMKTNIHHIAQGTTSRQVQKNMIGGRATGAFRGRVRVEQSAQQTDSGQLSRTVLLSDKARAWAVPSLEIIADDVQCTHGATVSDLSEEELFYLRSRGLGRAMARNLLMYAFAGDISRCVDPAMLGKVDSSEGLEKRVIRRLENLVPKGDRAIQGEFQSI